MTSLDDLNILFCYDEQKIGATKRTKTLKSQFHDVEIHPIPKQKIEDVNDEFTHIIIDKTATGTNLNYNTENIFYLTNFHRDDYSDISHNQIIVPDYQMPNTICRYNLQNRYENQYNCVGPLIETVTSKERTERLLVIGKRSYMINLAHWIVGHANDVKWTITSYDKNVCKLLKESNNYDHEVIYTSKIEPLLAKSKYVVHYGSHQLTMECIENNLVQLIIPPLNSRYHQQHAFRIREFKIGSYAFDIFHKIPMDRKYRILRSIRCNYRGYNQNLKNFKNKIQVNKCTSHTIFTRN